MLDLSHIFDSHAHYHDRRFTENEPPVDTVALMNTLLSEGLSGCINVGTDIDNSLSALAFARRFPGRVYAAVGMYPSSCPLTVEETVMENTLEQLRGMLSEENVVAIGEIGLDFHYDTVPPEIQTAWFARQLALAEETGYPVIIHNREAHGATFEMLSRYPGVTGVLHSYSGSAEMARQLCAAGWYISLSGVVTFKNAAKVTEVAEAVPGDRLLIETDCPYLTPVPHRGKLNHSGYLVHTAEKIAALRGISEAEVRIMTEKNARRLFRLPPA